MMNRTEMMDAIVRSLGFENPYTIEFFQLEEMGKSDEFLAGYLMVALAKDAEEED